MAYDIPEDDYKDATLGDDDEILELYNHCRGAFPSNNMQKLTKKKLAEAESCERKEDEAFLERLVKEGTEQSERLVYEMHALTRNSRNDHSEREDQDLDIKETRQEILASIPLMMARRAGFVTDILPPPKIKPQALLDNDTNNQMNVDPATSIDSSSGDSSPVRAPFTDDEEESIIDLTGDDGSENEDNTTTNNNNKGGESTKSSAESNPSSRVRPPWKPKVVDKPHIRELDLMPQKPSLSQITSKHFDDKGVSRLVINNTNRPHGDPVILMLSGLVNKLKPHQVSALHVIQISIRCAKTKVPYTSHTVLYPGGRSSIYLGECSPVRHGSQGDLDGGKWWYCIWYTYIHRWHTSTIYRIPCTYTIYAYTYICSTY